MTSDFGGSQSLRSEVFIVPHENLFEPFRTLQMLIQTLKAARQQYVGNILQSIV
jgi:hypothetical protein